MRKIFLFAPTTLLDVGCGDCTHARHFCENGILVTGVDIKPPKFSHPNFKFIPSFFSDLKITKKFDIVWASHIIEHMLDPQKFLEDAKTYLAPNGWLCLTFPPLKHSIVGGHINLFNAGIILYRAVLAGYDCSTVKIHQYGYNISVFIQNSDISVPIKDLNFDKGDIEIISKYLPEGYNFQGFDGDIKSLNW